MYLKVTRSGSRRYVQMVEAYRDPDRGQPKQRHLATLGRLDQLTAAAVEGVINGLRRVTARPALETLSQPISAERTPQEGSGTARQLAVGVVQTADGLPLTHEVFEGNVGEVTTVRGIVERLCQRFRRRRLVFIADRGMLSLDHLDVLDGRTLLGGRTVEYIVAVPARRCTHLTAGLATLHPQLVKASRRTGEESL